MSKLATRKESINSSRTTDFHGFKKHTLLESLRGRMNSDSNIGIKLKSLKEKVASNFTRSTAGRGEQRGIRAQNNVNKPACPIVAKARALLARSDKHMIVSRKQKTSDAPPCVGLSTVGNSEDTFSVGTSTRCGQSNLFGTTSASPDGQSALRQIQTQSQISQQAASNLGVLVAIQENFATAKENVSAGSSRKATQRANPEEGCGLGLSTDSNSHNSANDVLRLPERQTEPVTSSTFGKDQKDSSDSAIDWETVPCPVGNVIRSQHTACNNGQGCCDGGPSVRLPRIDRLSAKFDRTGRGHGRKNGVSRSSCPSSKSGSQNVRKLSKVRTSFRPFDPRPEASRLSALPDKGMHIYKKRYWKPESMHLSPRSGINVGPQPFDALPLGIPEVRAHENLWHSTVKPPVKPVPTRQGTCQCRGVTRILTPLSSVSYSESSWEERKGTNCPVRSDTTTPSHIQDSEDDDTVHGDVMSRNYQTSTRLNEYEDEDNDHDVNGSGISSSYAVSGSPARTSQTTLTPASLNMLGKFYSASSCNASFETIDHSGVELCNVKEKVGLLPHQQEQEISRHESSRSSSSSSGESNCQSSYSRKIVHLAKKNFARTRKWLAQQPDSIAAKRRTQGFGSEAKLDEVDYTHLFVCAFKQCFTQAPTRETLRNGKIRYETIHFHRILFPQRHRDQLAGRFDVSSHIPLREEILGSSSSWGGKEQASSSHSTCYARAEKLSLIAQQLRQSVWGLDAFRFLNYGSLIMSPISRILDRRRQIIKAGNTDLERFRVLDLGGAPVGDWAWAVAVTHEDFEVCTVTHHSQVGSLEIRGPENHTCLTLPCLWKLPFEDDYFNLISARTLHIYLHDRPPPRETRDEYDLVLRECLRILKPGGYIEYALLDSEIVGLGHLGDALSKQFTEILREEGYDPEPSRTFGDRLVNAGFSIPGEAIIFLPMGPRLRSTFFGLDMPEDQLVESDEDDENPSMSMNLASITGLLGARMWEQWLLKVQTETNKQPERRLDESIPVLLEKRAEEATGWNILMGWAKKPTPSRVTWASRVTNRD
ncbi:hypothetical protein KEM54_005574 [Ascosphaera aggregata]|nr:hypothetical protein KEM54_005574 [Ascosphaera aggregata]